MATSEQMAERHSRVLAELTELGLELARDLQAQARTADNAEARADLSLAFHRISRSVRQTLALDAQLKRDRERQGREARADLAREARERVSKRKAQLDAAVRREIWTEAEGSEAENLLADLDDWLEGEALLDDFVLAPIEEQIERIRRDLGLPHKAGGSPTAEWASTPSVSGLCPEPPPPDRPPACGRI